MMPPKMKFAWAEKRHHADHSQGTGAVEANKQLEVVELPAPVDAPDQPQEVSTVSGTLPARE